MVHIEIDSAPNLVKDAPRIIALSFPTVSPTSSFCSHRCHYNTLMGSTSTSTSWGCASFATLL